KGRVLQLAHGLDFLSIQAYRLWMEYPSRGKMKIAITGAGGFVGKELARFFSARRHVVALPRHSLDVTDGHAVRRMVTNIRPDLIINCAVLGLDDCEANPSMAHAVNVVGPQCLAEAAAEIDAEILHFSTNYVFDG